MLRRKLENIQKNHWKKEEMESPEVISFHFLSLFLFTFSLCPVAVVVEAKDLCYSVQIVKDPHKDEEKNTDDVEDEEDDIEDEEEPLRKKSKDETQREVRGEGGFSDVGLWNKLSQCLPNTKKKLSGALPCAGGEKDWLMLLENVQMKASPGQLVALMGPSGAGKCLFLFASFMFW